MSRPHSRESPPLVPFGPTNASSLAGDYRHIGAFFRNADERERVLLRFVREGFERGEKAFHICDDRHRVAHLQQLRESGIDVERALQEGRLELHHWDDTYFRAGPWFDPDAMLTLLSGALDGARAQGFPRTRLIAHMEWAAEQRPGSERLVEYETRFNLAFPQCPDWVVCCYDLSRFGGAVAVDLLRTHPMIIVGGVLQENPLFTPPDELLRELQAH